jgi:hypothetical protein
MIGAFARMLGNRERIVSCEQTADHAWSVSSRGPEGDAQAQGHDGPPERFVERFPHEGGDVFLAPMLDTLRAVLRRPRKEAGGTLPGLTQNEEPR